jgi:hypothetical protein
MRRYLPLMVLVLMIVAAVVAGIVLASAGSDGPSTAQPPPIDTRTAPPGSGAPTPLPRGAPADGPTRAGPAPGSACPVQTDICDFAVQVMSLIQAKDLNGLLNIAEPVQANCPEPGTGGFGGPSAELCRGATTGEARMGYWEVQAGEGLIVPEARFREAVQAWLDRANSPATERDLYGGPQARIGSIACYRDLSKRQGTCGDEVVHVIITFVSPEVTGPGSTPHRTAFYISAHRDSAGALRIEGIGQSVPPNAMLLAFQTESVVNGNPGIFAYYPWTP